MKLVYKSALTVLLISYCSSFCNSQINKIVGRYEYSSSGMNATGTRSFGLGYFLQINSNTDYASYFSVMNSDIYGERKLIYKVKYSNNKTIELFYEKCVGFDYPYEKETECKSYDSHKSGDKHFVFEVTDNGLQLLWDVDEIIEKNSLFKKVTKFSFVE